MSCDETITTKFWDLSLDNKINKKITVVTHAMSTGETDSSAHNTFWEFKAILSIS